MWVLEGFFRIGQEDSSPGVLTLLSKCDQDHEEVWDALVRSSVDRRVRNWLSESVKNISQDT